MVKEIGDKQNLQYDIDKLVKWPENWQMLFNFGKCKCLHTGSGNTGMNYEMGGNILSKTVKEKDLGVTMNANMKVSEQCRIAASKGNQILGMIRRNITYKEKSLIIPLYKAIFRPHLEYCIQAWNPHLRKDVDMLEQIQRRATKLQSSTYIIFMSGANGVAGWVWCGGGWVSVDRQLFRRLWCLGGFGAVVFGTLLRLELEGSREGILYDEIYITLLN